MPESIRFLCTGGSGFIGKHLSNYFFENQLPFINLDVNPPHQNSFKKYWKKVDILDFEDVQSSFLNFKPTHVIHLAARAEMEGKSLDDFKVNTEGTANIIAAIKITSTVRRFILTSTQHVRKPGSKSFFHDEEFDPLGFYGQSKVVTEKLTRSSNLNCCWTIIRPTNIWGPWHPHLPDGLWRLIKKGLYFHPNGKDVIRSYGYVKNAVWQIVQILTAAEEKVHNKVLYVGEEPSSQYEWINNFSLSLTGKPVKSAPRWIINLLAFIGDGFHLVGFPFPMYSSRYRNLITDNIVPIDPTIKLFGTPPFTLNEGISETVKWLENYWSK